MTSCKSENTARINYTYSQTKNVPIYSKSWELLMMATKLLLLYTKIFLNCFLKPQSVYILKLLTIIFPRNPKIVLELCICFIYLQASTKFSST